MKVPPARTIVVVLLASATMQSPLPAGIPALDISGSGRTGDRDWLVGYEITVHRDITITDLGKFDANGNGMLDDLTPPRVGLWDEIGQLQASATIDDSATLDDGAFYSSVSPTTLLPGTYVIGVQMFDEQEPYLTDTDVSTSSAISWVEGRRRSPADFRFPLTSSRRNSYFGPSFKIDEPIAMFGPMPSTIVQRDPSNNGQVKLDGVISGEVDRVEARAVVMEDSTGTDTDWQTVDTSEGAVAGTISVPAGGWYRIETRAYSGDALLGEDHVEQIGVGEVFITAGQSNSANFGSPRLVPQSDFVSAMDGQGGWGHARDPQPVANGSGGSPWPVLGDLLVEEFGVPVGFASVGWGGTSVAQWQPGASGPDSDPLYDRLKNAVELLGPHGARAVLWHQGETDANNSTSTERYVERLTDVIAQSREDAGFDIPWIVARASFLPQNSSRQEERILAGQDQVIAEDPLVLGGPLTDDLLGDEWRWDGIHFNEAGLREHAARWADAIRPVVVAEPSSLLLVLTAILMVAMTRRRRH